MKTKTTLTILCAATLLIAGCDVKDPIYNTAHPENGKIILTTDWSNRTDGVDVPGSYTIGIGRYSETATESTHMLDNLFEPGDYRIRVYNTPQYVGLIGDALVVEETVPPAGINERFVQPMPGWLFTSTLDAAIEADTDHELTAAMHQQVRQLTLFIEPAGGTTDRIEHIEGYLSGVASTLDMDNDTHGTPLNVALAFTKVTNGANTGKWTTTVRLLGVAGNRQTLHAKIFFEGNNPKPVSLTDADGNEGNDLTTALAGFNADKTTPLTLGGKVVETPTGSGFTATIKAWDSQESVTGDADLQ